MRSNLTYWFKKHKIETLLLVLVLFFSLAVRLYKIDEYLTFLGDEGRDVRIVRDLLKGNLVFIGPQTSIGNMYLGPLYYYMMAPALFLSRLNPVGPAIMVAILGVITIALTWFVTRLWFGRNAALFSAILFGLSPVAIIYSRSSWNPNPMPFFALVCIYGIYQVWANKYWQYLPIVGISLAFALQMHYLGLLLIPTLIIFYFLAVKPNWKNKNQKKQIITHSLISLALFFLLMSPLLLFDLKHHGLNYQAFKAFFVDRQTTVNFNPANSNRFLPLLSLFSQELILSRQANLALPTAIIFIILLFWLFQQTRSNKRKPLIICFSWLFLGLFGLGLYKQHVYAHYFGFLFPVVYILLGAVIAKLLSNNFLFKLISLTIFIYLIFLSIRNSPLKQPPNQQLQRTQEVVNLIIRESQNKPFNLGLIAKQNYDESYRYFFENKKAPLVRGETAITNQLFVICEDGDSCTPLGNPQWQIAVFGIAKIDKQSQIDHIKIYKLVHVDQN